MPLGLDIDEKRLVEICKQYQVIRLELFGSRAQGTARPDSDVDLLVTFEEGTKHGFSFYAMCIDLEAFFGRKVDVLTRRVVEADRNPIFKRCVLRNTEDLYAAWRKR